MSAFATTEREDVMTDYQFKTILKMVLDIADNTNDVEKVKASLRGFIGDEKIQSKPQKSKNTKVEK
ncbi:MAG: hypothetical protein FWH20_00605 [Oscillospiraceae bacterium]|nr:hypothetical protein [Oscillospiraceae bacterium]